jgi:hypothetical protein
VANFHLEFLVRADLDTSGVGILERLQISVLAFIPKYRIQKWV